MGSADADPLRAPRWIGAQPQVTSPAATMAYTDINGEDRLVLVTFAEHLEKGAWLGQRLRLEPGDF